MDVPVQPNLIERIHASGRPLVLAVTGGGSGALAALLQQPGASASVLEAIVPYASTALADWLGGPPDHYCSERTARAMAMAAFERARQLSDADPLTIRGIGATASLATTRPKRGPHRVHVAWQSADTTAVNTCVLPSQLSRAEEEQLATDMILDAVAEACAVERLELHATIRTSIERHEQRAPTEWTELLLGRRRSVAVSGHISGTTFGDPERTILFPGAFNPLHSGHKQMAKVADACCGSPVTFELSITNVDKPPLDFIEIADRASQFPGEHVLLTRAATFVEKAQIAPGCIFVVGVDTMVRIGDPDYYGGDPGRRDAAITAIRAAGCRFLVFGRAVDHRFQSLSDFEIPRALRAICDEVPESEFREDVSSTDLRGAPHLNHDGTTSTT